jgi:hypothetical protein
VVSQGNLRASEYRGFGGALFYGLGAGFRVRKKPEERTLGSGWKWLGRKVLEGDVGVEGF